MYVIRHNFVDKSQDQGRRNSIISGEAAQVKERTRGEISKNYFSQPLKSGEARASPASPVATPLTITKKILALAPGMAILLLALAKQELLNVA